MTPDPTVDTAEPDAALAATPVVDGSMAAADAASDDGGNGSLPLLFAFIAAIVAIGFLKSWWFPGILAGLLFVLFMHELGHYVTARASGMKVTEFFLGFGPKIWSFNRGETEYGVKAIPAGAYVRIMGMTNLEDVDPAEEHRTYRAQPYWQRMMTICAGSAMHFLMATVALFVLFTTYGYNGFNGPPWYVDVVVEGSTASSLGIEQGDQIISINGDTFANWDEFGDVIGDLEEGAVDIVIRRDGQQVVLAGNLGVRPEDVLLDGFGVYLLDEDPDAGLEAAFVWPSESADAFGLKQGDLVVSAGGIDHPDQIDIASLVVQGDGQELEIEVLRGSSVQSMEIPAVSPDDTQLLVQNLDLGPNDRLLRIDGQSVTDDASLRTTLGELEELVMTVDVRRGGELVALTDTVELRTVAPFRGFFGVGPEFVPDPDPGIGKSASLAVKDFGIIAKTNLVGLGDMVNPNRWIGSDDVGVERRAAELARQTSAENAPPVSSCSGPDSEDTNRPLSVVGIGRLISCSESVDQVLFLFAIVNIFIGIFNLLPVLPVDGGHALIATYERIRGLITRRPHRVDAAKLIPVTWAVIILLVGVGVWTTALDIFSWPS